MNFKNKIKKHKNKLEIVAIVLAILLIREYVLCSYIIESPNNPVYKQGTRVFVNKLSPYYRDMEDGEIVAIMDSENIQRCVRYRNGQKEHVIGSVLFRYW